MRHSSAGKDAQLHFRSVVCSSAGRAGLCIHGIRGQSLTVFYTPLHIISVYTYIYSSGCAWHDTALNVLRNVNQRVDM